MTARYESLLSAAPLPEDLAAIPPMPAFAEAATGFVEAFSTHLFRMPAARRYPELTALAFWMRKSNLARVRTEMRARAADSLLVPRGTVLHIAPSNVDTMFVYSWLISLLTGNRNIVRLSSRPSAQADELVGAVATLLADPAHADIARRTLLVRYAPDDLVTERLSAVCDVRVVWGGDSVVRQIRRLALPPTAIEVAFPNKYSLALVHARRWQEADEERKAAWVEAFYNDAYWFDQMACSSPRQVLWIGTPDQAGDAAADFWPRLERVLASHQARFADVDYVNKRVAQDGMAIETAVRIPASRSNDLARVWLDVPALHDERHCGAGLFFESALPDLEALRPLLARRVQTISYAGLTKDELSAFVAAGPITGIDRIVPFGRALEFSTVWDGFDLLRVFTREVTVA